MFLVRLFLLLVFGVAGVLPVFAQAEPAPEQPRFNIFEFRVEGNTVLPADQIERAVYPMMGEGKTIADVESARGALEKVYRDAGYGTVSVDIPEQNVDHDVVVLHVLEGQVSRLRVLGSRYFSQGRILAQVTELAEGKVPHFPVVQAQLADVNVSQDKRVTPMLRPGKLPGTTEVDLNVQDELPLHASLELNNAYSPNTSHARLSGMVHYDNLFQRDHRATLQVLTSPARTQEVQVMSGSYLIPDGDHHWSFSLVNSDSTTAAGVGGITVFGRGSSYSLHDILSLPGEGSFTHSLNYGLDYKHFDEKVTIGPNAGFSTPVRYAPFSLAYSASVAQGEGRWDFGIGWVFAVRNFLSRQSDFDDKRYKARSNFSVLKFELGRLQPLPHDFSLWAKVDGQLAAQPLVSNEQYVAGGANNVRGYLDATQSGDSALRGSLELRAPDLSGALGPAVEKNVADFLPYAFIDAAALELRDPLPGQQSRFELLSTGVGLRLRLKEHFSLNLDLALPLRGTTYTHKNDLHLHSSAVLEF
jgi:hemolysin activation/secretion protein